MERFPALSPIKTIWLSMENVPRIQSLAPPNLRYHR